MIAKLSAGVFALCLLSAPAFAQGAKPTDPQIAHIAYTAGVLDVEAAKQAIAEIEEQGRRGLRQRHGARPRSGERAGARRWSRSST